MVKVMNDRQRTVSILNRVPPSQIENIPAYICPHDGSRKRAHRSDDSDQAPCRVKKRVIFGSPSRPPHSMDNFRNGKNEPLTPVPKAQMKLDIWLTPPLKCQSLAKNLIWEDGKKVDARRPSGLMNTPACSGVKPGDRHNRTDSHGDSKRNLTGTEKHTSDRNRKTHPLKRTHSDEVLTPSKAPKYETSGRSPAYAALVRSNIPFRRTTSLPRGDSNHKEKHLKPHTHKPVLSNECSKCNNLYRNYQAGSCTEVITACLRVPVSRKTTFESTKLENTGNTLINHDQQQAPLSGSISDVIKTPGSQHVDNNSEKVESKITKRIYRSEKALKDLKRRSLALAVGASENIDSPPSADLQDVGNQSPSISSTVNVPLTVSKNFSNPIVLLKKKDIINPGKLIESHGLSLSPRKSMVGISYSRDSDDVDVKIVHRQTSCEKIKRLPSAPMVLAKYSNLSTPSFTNALKLSLGVTTSTRSFQERETNQVQILEESGFVRSSIDTVDLYSSSAKQPDQETKFYLIDKCVANTAENLALCQKTSHILDRLQKLSIEPRHRTVWQWDDLFNVVKGFDLSTPVTDDNYKRKYVHLVRLRHMASAMEEDVERCRIETYVHRSIVANFMSADMNLRNVLKVVSWLPRAVIHCVIVAPRTSSSRKHKCKQAIYPTMLQVLQKLLHMAWVVSRNLSAASDRIASELVVPFGQLPSRLHRRLFLDTLQSHSIRMKLLQLFLDPPSSSFSSLNATPRKMSLRTLVDIYFKSAVVSSKTDSHSRSSTESSTLSPEVSQELVYFLYSLARSYVNTCTGQLHIPVMHRKTARAQLTEEDRLVLQNFGSKIEKLRSRVCASCPTTKHLLHQLEVLCHLPHVIRSKTCDEGT